MNFFKPTIDQARTVKKDWLVALIIQFITGIAVLTIMNRANPVELPFPRWIFTAASLAASIIALYIIYYCAYKKNGTKWLLFTLIGMGISLPMSFFQYVAAMGLANTLVLITIQFYYALHCVRLYIINKQLQKQEKAAL